jgi:ethanolamine transporter EutH
VSKEKGMNIITYIACYILSILNIKQNKYDTAYGMLNNATIQMEKSGSECEILTLLNKINMYKILTHMNAAEKAENCLNQAKYIVDKYNLNFDLNIDTE